MSWTGGVVHMQGKTRHDIANALESIRYSVRSEANLAEFPNMGENLQPLRDVRPNKVFDSEEDALDYCENLGFHREYNCLVAYKDLNEIKETKKIKDLKERLEKEKEKLLVYKKEHSIAKFKSKLISCSKCQSKINKDYIRNDICPLCKENLRSETTKKTIDRYNKNIKDVNEKIVLEKKKQSSKLKTKYLINYCEYVG